MEKTKATALLIAVATILLFAPAAVFAASETMYAETCGSVSGTVTISDCAGLASENDSEDAGIAKNAVARFGIQDPGFDGTITGVSVSFRHGGEPGIGGNAGINFYDALNSAVFCSQDNSTPNSEAYTTDIVEACTPPGGWTLEKLSNLEIRIQNRDNGGPDTLFLSYLAVTTGYTAFVCGNSAIEGGEVCDSGSLAGETCESQGFDFGALACRSDCLGYDTTGCGDFFCGNNVIEGSETCDSTALADQTCVGLGFSSGELSCLSDCSNYDTSACENFSCGNGIIEGNESCDGIVLAGETCESLGFDSGELSCLTDCSGFDTANCATTEVCGNGSIGGPEKCDANLLGGQTCEGLGYESGSLACSTDCLTFDVSDCISSEQGTEGECGYGCCGGGTCDPEFGEDYGTCRSDCPTPLALHFETISPLQGEEFASGDEVIVRVKIMADSVPGFFASAKASGKFGEIILLDDGGGADETAGDAVYSGSFFVGDENTFLLREILYSAAIADTNGESRAFYQVSPLLALRFSTNKQTYTFGDAVRISGLVSRKGIPLAADFNLSITVDEKELFFGELSSGENGSFAHSFQTSIAHPEGEWKIKASARDELGNFGFLEKTIRVFEPNTKAPISISVDSGVSPTVERGSRIKIIAKALDEYGEHIDGAKVILADPLGNETILAETGNRNYAGFYEVPLGIDAGVAEFTIRASKERGGGTIRGSETFTLNIAESSLGIEVLSPEEGVFYIGSSMKIRARVTGPDLAPVFAEVTAVVNGNPVELTALGEGIYEAVYIIKEGDTGKILLGISAKDDAGNFWDTEEFVFVENGYSHEYYIRNYPVESAAAGIVFLGIAAWFVLMAVNKVEAGSAAKKRKELKAKLAALEEKYYKTQTINRAEYTKLRSELESELDSLEKTGGRERGKK